MLSVALGFTVLLGMPLGVLMFLTGKQQLHARPRVPDAVDAGECVPLTLPFIILLIVL